MFITTMIYILPVFSSVKFFEKDKNKKSYVWWLYNPVEDDDADYESQYVWLSSTTKIQKNLELITLRVEPLLTPCPVSYPIILGPNTPSAVMPWENRQKG